MKPREKHGIEFLAAAAAVAEPRPIARFEGITMISSAAERQLSRAIEQLWNRRRWPFVSSMLRAFASSSNADDGRAADAIRLAREIERELARTRHRAGPAVSDTRPRTPAEAGAEGTWRRPDLVA